MDMASTWAQNFIIDLIHCRDSNPILWIAPPSGTLSKARMRPVKSEWKAMGVPDAPQLRSDQWPTGLPEAYEVPALSGQLCDANNLIDFALKAVSHCIEQERPWFVQNPRNSYLWNYSCWDKWVWTDTDIAQCEYGANRPNPIRIRSSTKWINDLARTCSGTHSHTPWEPQFENGVFSGFAGASTKGLPKPFAEAVASAIAKECQQAKGEMRGYAQSVITAAKITATNCDANKARVARISAASGVQARGRRVEQLITEYKEEHIVQIANTDCAGLTRRQRLNNTRTLGGRQFLKDTQIVGMTGGVTPGMTSLRLGIPWTPIEFFLKARSLPHPFEANASPDETIRAVFVSATMGPAYVEKMREDFFTKWEARAAELVEEEAKLIATLHIDIQPFAAKKRPLLLREMLRHYGFPASELVFEMLTTGAPMFGPFPRTGVSPKGSTLPQ